MVRYTDGQDALALRQRFYQTARDLPVIPTQVLQDGDMPADEARELIAARAEQRALAAESVFGGHYLRGHELEALTEGRAVFNGSTDAYLDERYGPDRVSHVWGVGWFLDMPHIDNP